MIINTGKYLSEEDTTKAHHLADMATGPASGMVITDRVGAWPEGATCPRTEGEIYRKRFHDFINTAAVDAGLPPAEEFIDEDGDEVINHYGVNFETRELLGWDRSAA